MTQWQNLVGHTDCASEREWESIGENSVGWADDDGKCGTEGQNVLYIIA